MTEAQKSWFEESLKDPLKYRVYLEEKVKLLQEENAALRAQVKELELKLVDLRGFIACDLRSVPQHIRDRGRAIIDREGKQ